MKEIGNSEFSLDECDSRFDRLLEVFHTKNGSPWTLRLLVVALFFLHCIIAPPTYAAPCTLENIVQLPSWIKQQEEKGRWVDIAQCIRDRTVAIERAASKMGSDAADDFRYAVSQGLSNAIESGPVERMHQLAASTWEAYLSNRSQTTEIRRLNQAVRKLVHHGRVVGLDPYLPTIFNAIDLLGERQYYKTGNLLLNTLYRCGSWDVPKTPADETVCQFQCKPLFERYLLASISITNLPLSKMTQDQPKLIPDIRKLQQRLAICSDVQ